MFREQLRSCKVYGEYGVGSSTDWVYNNTNALILAAETSKSWSDRVIEKKDPSRIDIDLIDIGPVGEWGRPLDFSRREKFKDYCSAIWRHNLKPDVVLIDGRFRVSCFMTSVLNGEPGSKVIFDDYVNRAHYHVVEEILNIKERCGRQVLFEIPHKFDRDKANFLAQKFEYVID